MLPNVIIGGAQKAGTTSLFRYLSSHPSVCPSMIKEIHFFLKHQHTLKDEDLKKYHTFFTGQSENKTIFLEASPMYLSNSSDIASIMHHTLPDIKLIFILREPVSILRSYIKFKNVIDGVNYPMELFSALARGNDFEKYCKDGVSINNALHHLHSGCFIKNLIEFLSYYPREQIGIFFFDELSQNTPEFMKKVCKFLDIEKNYYDNFPFSVENKTRSYRSPKLHIAITRLNMKIEPVFNRFPSFRNSVRSFYHLLFEKKNVVAFDNNDEIKNLENFYLPYNKELFIFLKKNYPFLEFPYWLNFFDE